MNIYGTEHLWASDYNLDKLKKNPDFFAKMKPETLRDFQQVFMGLLEDINFVISATVGKGKCFTLPDGACLGIQCMHDALPHLTPDPEPK